MAPLLFISCGSSSPPGSGGADGEVRAVRKEGQYPQTQNQPAPSLPFLLGRELTPPFHFLDVASSGFTIIKCTHRRVGCLTLEKRLCVRRWGSIFWKHFIFIHPHQSISPKAHLCIQKAQALCLRTTSWQRLGF